MDFYDECLYDTVSIFGWWLVVMTYVMTDFYDEWFVWYCFDFCCMVICSDFLLMMLTNDLYDDAVMVGRVG